MFFNEDSNHFNLPSGNIAWTFRNEGLNGEDVIVFSDGLKEVNGNNFIPYLLNELMEADSDASIGRHGQRIQKVLEGMYPMYLVSGFPDALKDNTAFGILSNDRIMKFYFNGAFSNSTIESILDDRYFNHQNSLSSSSGINTFEENINFVYTNVTVYDNQGMNSFTKELYSLIVGRTPIQDGYNEESLNNSLESAHHFFDDENYRLILEEKIK